MVDKLITGNEAPVQLHRSQSDLLVELLQNNKRIILKRMCGDAKLQRREVTLFITAERKYQTVTVAVVSDL